MPTIQLAEGTLSYQDQGSGFPIVFGHSYLWNAAMWRPQVEALSGRYRCIVPELWNHGDSDDRSPGNVYELDRLAADHIAVLDALGIERCAIVGLSVGGMWGYRVALQQPERVAALVLAGTDVGAEPEVTRQNFFAMIEAVAAAKAIPLSLVEVMLPLFFSDRTLGAPPGFVGAFRTALGEISPGRIPGLLAIGRGIFGRGGALDRLGDIVCPTAVVVGEQDRSRPPHEAKRMAAGIPGAELHVLEGAGHISNLEAPDAFTTIIESLLDGVS